MSRATHGHTTKCRKMISDLRRLKSGCDEVVRFNLLSASIHNYIILNVHYFRTSEFESANNDSCVK